MAEGIGFEDRRRFVFMEMLDVEREGLQERLELSVDRIREIQEEHFGNPAFEGYFTAVAKFLMQIEDTRLFLEKDGLQTTSLEELKQRNHALYEDIMPEHYAESYANPTYAVNKLGEDYGAMLAFLYTEMRSLIVFVHEGKLDELVIRMELFVEVYAAFTYEWQENGELPATEAVRQILYWFVSDYADVAEEQRIYDMVVPGGTLQRTSFATVI